MEYSGVKFRVIRFEEKYALLKHDDEKIGYVLWPIEEMPESTPLGSEIYLAVNCENGSAEREHKNGIPGNVNKEEQYEMMRRLLEELVN